LHCVVCCSDDAVAAAAASLSLAGRRLSVIVADRKASKPKLTSTASEATDHAADDAVGAHGQ